MGHGHGWSTFGLSQILDFFPEDHPERQDLLAVEHGRREQAARAAAVATTLADARGWFTLAPVPPGSYTLYARMVSDKADLEWVEALRVGDTPVRIDLDESKVHGLPPK